MWKYNKALLVSLGLMASMPAVVHAQKVTRPVDWLCSVEQRTVDGEWSAYRRVSVAPDGRTSASRDTYEWKPTSRLAFGNGAYLSWELSYYWPTSTLNQSAITESDVTVELKFYFPQPGDGPRLRKPERSWLHLYRTTGAADDQPSHRTSLVDLMLWDQSNDGSLRTAAHISLSDLLAFGTGFDSLVWNIRSAPDEYGGTNSMARGIFPVSTIRNKTSAILNLRRQLNQKANRLRTDCNGDPPLAVDYYPPSPR